MTVHALVSPQDSIVTRSSNVDPNVQTKAGYRWLPVETAGDDAFDSETHTKDGPVTTIETSRVLDTYTVRLLNAQEISDRKDGRINSINGSTAILKVLLNQHNRLRTLEGQSTHTMAQFKAAIKALL